MLKKIPTLFLLIALSCSIIDDDVILTKDDLGQLLLKELVLNQDTQDGSGEIKIGFLYDSTINKTAGGITIVRRIGYSVPSLSNFKIRLRSNSSAATKAVVSMQSENKPYTYFLYDKDSIIEKYTFTYNSAGKVATITTVINPIDNAKPTIRTSDTFTYGSDGRFTQMQRTSPTGAVQGTFTILMGGGQEDNKLRKVSISNTSWEINDCPSGCSITDYAKTVGGSIVSQMTFKSTLLDDLLSSVEHVDGCCTNTSISNYFLHPTLFLATSLESGVDFYYLYMIDWWSPTTTPRQQNKNNRVTVELKYGYNPRK